MKKVIDIVVKFDGGREQSLASYFNAVEQAIRAEKNKSQKARQFIQEKGLMKEFKNKK